MSTTTTSLTPTQRFAAHAVKLALPHGRERRGLDFAQQVEGFPHNYQPASVELAQALIARVAVEGMDELGAQAALALLDGEGR